MSEIGSRGKGEPFFLFDTNTSQAIRPCAWRRSKNTNQREEKNMKKAFTAAFGFAAVSVLTGCGGVNSALVQRHETVELYHIFDVKTKASPETVIKATADGIAQNTNSLVQNRPLQIGGKVPPAPGRFELVNIADAFKGTGMGAILAMNQGGAGNASMRSAKCEGALWTSKATRDIAGSDNLNLYTCIYRYRDGYQLDMYGVFRKTSGGLTEIARGATQAMVGTPEQWTTKTIVDTVRSVQAATGAHATYVEGQPELGDLPKLDSLTSSR